MDSSRLSFKLFVDTPADLDLHEFVPLFHSWIQTHAIKDHLLIDVADYSHVHNGPGIVLISHEANWSLDRRDGKLGLTYQRKQSLDGSFADRVRNAYSATQAAASLLRDKLKFRADQIEFRICDRLVAPNTAETFAAVKSDLLQIFPNAKLEHRPSKAELFEVTINPA